MKIYSFEFGTKPVKYELSKYNDKTFFGTMSRSFYPSRSMIVVDRPDDFKSIESGTMFKPIVSTKYKSLLDIVGFSFNLNLISSDEIVSYDENGYCDYDEDLAIIIIDSDVYRLVDYTIRPDNFHNEDDGLSMLIPKVWKGKTTDVAIMSVSHSMSINSFAMVLVLYNRMIKQYEYFRINKTIDGLSCDNDTKKVGKDVIKLWIDYDEANGRKTSTIHEYIPWPAGKLYITPTKYKKELEDLIDSFNIKRKPIIATVDDSQMNDIPSVIKKSFHGKKNALVWYKLPIVKCEGSAIELNLSMDETGVIRG